MKSTSASRPKIPIKEMMNNVSNKQTKKTKKKQTKKTKKKQTKKTNKKNKQTNY
jgi:hypothetical protein